MKPCERVDALLSDFLEQETSPAEARFVERHLAVCPRCRAQLREMQWLQERLSQLEPVEVSPDFTDQVLSRTRDLPPAGLDEPVLTMPRSQARVWAIPLAAAAVVAVVAIGVVRFSSPLPSAPQLTDSAPVSPAMPGNRTPEARPLVEAARKAKARPLVKEMPRVTTLSEVRPDLASGAKNTAQPLGMAHDAYALDEWVLRQPAEGGASVLTRVQADSSARVMVTF